MPVPAVLAPMLVLAGLLGLAAAVMPLIGPLLGILFLLTGVLWLCAPAMPARRGPAVASPSIVAVHMPMATPGTLLHICTPPSCCSAHSIAVRLWLCHNSPDTGCVHCRMDRQSPMQGSRLLDQVFNSMMCISLQAELCQLQLLQHIGRTSLSHRVLREQLNIVHSMRLQALKVAMHQPLC